MRTVNYRPMTCGNCGEETPRRSARQKWCPSCRESIRKVQHREVSTRWAALNRSRVTANARAWAERNPERVKAAQRAHRERHSADYLAAVKRYQAAHPERVAAQKAKRRVREQADRFPVGAKEWRRVLERYGHACAYCGERTDLTVDHVQPLARGGRHAIGNLVPACKSCNSKKSARLLVEWRYRKAG